MDDIAVLRFGSGGHTRLRSDVEVVQLYLGRRGEGHAAKVPAQLCHRSERTVFGRNRNRCDDVRGSLELTFGKVIVTDSLLRCA